MNTNSPRTGEQEKGNLIHYKRKRKNTGKEVGRQLDRKGPSSLPKRKAVGRETKEEDNLQHRVGVSGQ